MSFPQPSDFRPPIIPDGEVYDNPENGRSYYWTQILLPEGSTPDTATTIGGYWTVVCDSANGKYVLVAGDTMTGTLEIANEGDNTDLEFDPDKANLTFTTTKTDGSDSKSVSIHQNGFDSSLSITGGVVADGSYFSESGRYYGADPSGQYFLTRNPYLKLEKLEGTLQWDDSARVQWDELGGSLQWDDSARVQWNEFNVEIPKPVENDANSDGFIIRGTTANGYETDEALGQDERLLSVYHNADKADAVNYAGKINADRNLVNKGYVDAKDELLRQDIIELEEEINAIAPSLEYGKWEWEQPANKTRPPEKGTFYLLDDFLELTESYDNASSIVISNYEYDDPNDNDPVDVHTWADANPDELIQLFDAADPDFLLGKIVQVHPDSTDYVRIEITRIQSSGVPNDNLDPVSNKYLTRVNVFKEPSGGTASDFVLKAGDTMLGNLKITTDANTDKAATLTLEGQRTSSSASCGTVKFNNATSGTAASLEYHTFGTDDPWFSFTQDVQFNNKNISKINNIELSGPGTISCREHIAMEFKETPDANEGNAHVIVKIPKDDQRKGFLIRGRKSDKSDGDLFYNYRNSGTNGDSIDYQGICTTGTHIMNREHGDNRFVQTGTKGIKITKSGSTYYIEGG